MSINDGCTILIVDDARCIRKIVRKSLLDMGFSDIIEAVHGKEALEKLIANKESVGLIISDINMPIMDGVEFFNEVQIEDELALIPFMFLSAESESRFKEKYKNYALNCYLQKPFDYEKFEFMVQYAINVDKKTGVVK